VRHKKVVAMVCDKCEKKLGKVITPDPWKSGARNTTEGGGRKVIIIHKILISVNLLLEMECEWSDNNNDNRKTTDTKSNSVLAFFILSVSVDCVSLLLPRHAHA